MYLFLAMLVLLIPIRFLMAAMISAGIHELFHIAAIHLFGKRIYSVSIAPHGATIYAQPMERKEEALCALAGPVSGFLLALLFRWFPVMALTGIIQSIYNLLPIFPTDGGRVLQCCVHGLFCKAIADTIVYWTEIVTLSIVIASCVYFSIRFHFGIIPLLFAVARLLKSVKLK